MRVNVAVMGYVTEAEGRVLLIRRDDTRTWAPPAGGLQIGEAPEDAVRREVLEETGIRVRTLGLVSVELRVRRPNPLLVLAYRCAVVGGRPRRSGESVEVVFAEPGELPAPMLSTHRRELALAATEDSGQVPYLVRPISIAERLTLMALRRLVYPVKNLKRRLGGRPYEPPPLWDVTSHHAIDVGPPRVIDIQLDAQQAAITLATTGCEPSPGRDWLGLGSGSWDSGAGSAG